MYRTCHLSRKDKYTQFSIIYNRTVAIICIVYREVIRSFELTTASYHPRILAKADMSKVQIFSFSVSQNLVFMSYWFPQFQPCNLVCCMGVSQVICFLLTHFYGISCIYNRLLASGSRLARAPLHEHSMVFFNFFIEKIKTTDSFSFASKLHCICQVNEPRSPQVHFHSFIPSIFIYLGENSQP